MPNRSTGIYTARAAAAASPSSSRRVPPFFSPSVTRYSVTRYKPERKGRIRSACRACRGHCCRNGGNDAYLDENAIRLAWARHPRLSRRGLMQLYLDAIPDKAFADSCLFHAKDGCSLPRSLRAPVSEAYLCGPLMRLMKG